MNYNLGSVCTARVTKSLSVCIEIIGKFLFSVIFSRKLDGVVPINLMAFVCITTRDYISK